MFDCIRVAVCEHSPTVRYGLRNILSATEEIQIVKEVSEHQEILPVVGGMNVDILFTDLNPDTPSELVCLREFKTLRPEVKIIVFTNCVDSALIMQALDLDIHGFKLKAATAEDIINTIQSVYKGKTCLAPCVTAALLDHMRSKRSYEVSSLSEREQEVLHLIAEGKSNREIAEKLDITVRTVKFHTGSIFSKLNVRNRTQAALKVA